jgi:hypothetical protein
MGPRLRNGMFTTAKTHLQPDSPARQARIGQPRQGHIQQHFLPRPQFVPPAATIKPIGRGFDGVDD